MSAAEIFFTNKKRQQQLENRKYLAASLAFTGLILLVPDLRAIGDKSIVNFVDETAFVLAGTILFFSNMRKISRIKGSFIQFENERLSFQSRGIERKHIPLEMIRISELKEHCVVIETSREKGLQVFLEDYPEKERKVVTEKFRELEFA